jgi:hypothetical protein
MERDHVLSTWSRRTTHWTLNRTLISRSPVLTSFRKSYHFQLTTIVLRACSLLVDWDPYRYRREVNRQNHKAKIHDMIQIIIARRKENEVARYNREIFKMIHHFDDLIMLWQKNTIKLESKRRDSFKISDYDESHDIFFTFVQLNDRKIRDSFHDDHLKIFTSRTEYLLSKESLDTLSVEEKNSGLKTIHEFISREEKKKASFVKHTCKHIS